MRKRVVAFGCSYTYGHSLPDCHSKEDNGPGPEPSAMAWPALVANKLGQQCVNYGVPGFSNKEIWHWIMNARLTSLDTVVVMWTYTERWAVIHPDRSESIGVHFMNKPAKCYYRHLQNSFDSNIDLNLRIHHAAQYLTSLGIKNYHTILERNKLTKTSWNDTPVLDIYLEDYKTRFGVALDGMHPGEEAHAMFANDIYKKITRKE